MVNSNLKLFLAIVQSLAEAIRVTSDATQDNESYTWSKQGDNQASFGMYISPHEMDNTAGDRTVLNPPFTWSQEQIEVKHFLHRAMSSALP